MDLSSMLNKEDDDAQKHLRRRSGSQSQSRSQSRQPTLPSLRTSSGSYRSPGAAPAGPASIDSPYSAQRSSQSPALQRLSRPDHAYHTSPLVQSPGGALQYSQAGSLSSPYGISRSTLQYPQTMTPASPYHATNLTPGGSQHPYGYQQPPNLSLSSTPSSTHAQTPQTHHESPLSQYPYSNQPLGYGPRPVSQPDVPPGLPSGPPFRLPSHGSSHSSASLSALHSPANGPYNSPRGLIRPSTQSTISHLVNVPPVYQSNQSAMQGALDQHTDRDRSLSVSPKTIVTASLPSRGPSISDPVMTPIDHIPKPSGMLPVGGAKQNSRHQRYSSGSSSTQNSSDFLIDPLRNKHIASTSDNAMNTVKTKATRLDVTRSDPDKPFVHSSLEGTPEQPSTVKRNLITPAVTDILSTNPVVLQLSANHDTAIRNLVPTSLKRELDADSTDNVSKAEHPTKRRRLATIPIWAQRCKATNPLKKYRTAKPVNGNGAVEASGTRLEHVQHEPSRAPLILTDDDGPLGKLEPSVTNIIPYDEITRAIMDFLMTYVVRDQTLQTRAAGGPTSAAGLLEIEAKMGTLIDRNSNERLRLPIKTEVVLDEKFDVAFESMMTEEQHQNFNRRLNEACERSKAPPASNQQQKPRETRRPIEYAHTNEKDTFYNLPDSEVSGLPPGIQARIGRGKKAKLRVTRDQKSGKITAQIIKIRIADLHISSPNTPFDWRVSVSAEVNWMGDWQSLVEAAKREGQSKPTPDRNKNRVSYRHQYCQIDLTQVKSGLENATHELEVELDATTVREQGLLVDGREGNSYEGLIQSFVDNVRTLVRMRV